MEKQYHISKNGTYVGPSSKETIVSKIESEEYQWTDYIYDEKAGDWIMLLNHPEFSMLLKQGPVSTQNDQDYLKEKKWFFLREGNNHGPFSQLEIIQMLQIKSLTAADYIWHERFSGWRRIAEVKNFSAESIRKVKETNDKDISEVFFRRRYSRVSYGASVIVHNNKTVFRGQAQELSVGGAGIFVDNSDFITGHSLFLHFQAGEGVPPFNAVCQIVSRQTPKQKNDDAATDMTVKYGVKFTILSQSTRESIKNFTNRAIV